MKHDNHCELGKLVYEIRANAVLPMIVTNREEIISALDHLKIETHYCVPTAAYVTWKEFLDLIDTETNLVREAKALSFFSRVSHSIRSRSSIILRTRNVGSDDSNDSTELLRLSP
jgi:hypothetical protein